MRPRAGGRTAFQRLLLACCLAIAAPVGLFAQESNNARTYWVPTRQFKIPFNVDYDPRITAVLLLVAENGQDYRNAGTAAPAQGQFFFRADHDGTYSFIVQTRDQGGVLTPSDLRGVPPRIRICVDTQKPVLRLEAAKQEGWPAAIRWEVQDDNFDYLRADYRSVNGGDWYPLLLPREPNKVHGWIPAVGGRLEVRVQAHDKAGNMSEPCTVTVEPDPRGGNGMPPAGNGGGEANDVKYVRSKKFQLAYQLDKDSLGPSGVKSVDIWKMREGGAWQKCREVGEKDQSVVTVTVESAGRWGFRLIPRSGVGLAEPDPRPGDRPDLWVEVDEQAPYVKINRLLVGRGADAGNLTISYTASDKFLRARPIAVYYRNGEQGEWREVARDLENKGSYTFKPLDLDPRLYELYVRVTATDEAGNEGEAVSKEAVKVDLKVPRIKQIQVQPSAGEIQSRGPAPMPAPPPGGMLTPSSSPLPPQSTPTGFPAPSWDQGKKP